MKNTTPKMGRPPIPPPSVKKAWSVRLNDEQNAKVVAGGGGQYVRDLIDAAPWPKAPTKKPPEGGS